MKFGKKQILPVLLVVLLFTIGTTTGTTMAKYVTEREISSQVTFTAKLAEKMVLEEYKVIRTNKGDYVYETKPDSDQNIIVNANDYVLMPGVDIVKKPYIQISKKTPIKAYLFLEVVGHQPGAETNGVQYTLEDEWKPAMTGEGAAREQMKGRHEGLVYVYSSGGNPVELDENLTKTDGFKNIDIISGGKVYVSQHLNKSAEKFEIKFYAVMAEVVDGKSLADIYNDAVTIPGTP